MRNHPPPLKTDYGGQHSTAEKANSNTLLRTTNVAFPAFTLARPAGSPPKNYENQVPTRVTSAATLRKHPEAGIPGDRKSTGNYRYHYQCDQLYIIGRHSDRGKPSSVPRVHHPPRIPYIGREATGEGAGIPHPRDRLYTSPPLTRSDRGTTGPHPLTACVYNLWYAAPGPTRSP